MFHPPRPAPRSCPWRPRLSGLPASPAGPGADVEDPTWPDPGCEGGTRVTLPAPRSHAHRLELSPLRSPPKCQEQQTLEEKSLRGGSRGHHEERGALAPGSGEPQKEPQAGVPALSHRDPCEKSKSLQAKPRSPTPPPGGLPAPASPAGKRPGRSGPLVSTPNPTPLEPMSPSELSLPTKGGDPHRHPPALWSPPSPAGAPRPPVTMGSFQNP